MTTLIVWLLIAVTPDGHKQPATLGEFIVQAECESARYTLQKTTARTELYCLPATIINPNSGKRK